MEASKCGEWKIDFKNREKIEINFSVYLPLASTWDSATFQWDNLKKFMSFVIYIKNPTIWAQPHLRSSIGLEMASQRVKAFIFDKIEIAVITAFTLWLPIFKPIELRRWGCAQIVGFLM